jgi:hypothetical protein
LAHRDIGRCPPPWSVKGVNRTTYRRRQTARMIHSGLAATGSLARDALMLSRVGFVYRQVRTATRQRPRPDAEIACGEVSDSSWTNPIARSIAHADAAMMEIDACRRHVGCALKDRAFGTAPRQLVNKATSNTGVKRVGVGTPHGACRPSRRKLMSASMSGVRG